MKKSAKSSASLNSISADLTPEEEWANEIPSEIIVADVLDLHGTPMKIIPEIVAEFLDNAVRLELPTVQIIHGKGKSRLKHIVLELLESASNVMRFYDAPPQLGGWGRTIVDLKFEKTAMNDD